MYYFIKCILFYNMVGYLKCIKNGTSTAIVVKGFWKIRSIGKLPDYLKSISTLKLSFIY